MVQPTLVRWAKFVLDFPASFLSTSRVLAQASIERNELRHDISKPPRELAVNPPAMPSGSREADELEMLALTAGLKNMGRGGYGRD
jgi:hypothetical protein